MAFLLSMLWGRKSTAGIREFGSDRCLWELEGSEKLSVVLGRAYILGLHLNILRLSNLSLFPVPLPLFQAVLRKELFSSNVQKYISCLGRKMLVCPVTISGWLVSFYRPIFFRPGILVRNDLLLDSEHLFKFYYLRRRQTAACKYVHCCNMPCATKRLV